MFCIHLSSRVDNLFVISRYILRLGFWIMFVIARISLYRGSVLWPGEENRSLYRGLRYIEVR